MKISVLREFITLAKHGKFSTAARLQNMSQSGLSKHIAELEKEIGVRLVEREANVSLTPAGRHLLNKAEELLFFHDEIITECRSIGRSQTRRLFVYTPLIVDKAGISLTKACRDIAVSDTLINVSYQSYGNESLFQVLAAERADFGLFRSFDDSLTQHSESGTTFDLLPLSKDVVSVWMKDDHKLAELPSLSPYDLEGIPIFVPAGDAFETERIVISSFFSLYGITPRYSFVPINTIEEFGMANLEKGIYLLAQHFDKMQVLDRPGLISRADFEPRLYITTYGIFRHGDNNPALEKLLDILQTTLPEEF